MVGGIPLTVRTLYEQGLKKLTECSVENPQTDARAILENILNIDFGKIILHYDDVCEESAAEIYLEKISQRCGFMPLAYIINHKEFFSLPFFVKEGVLVPRPETENLVSAVLSAVEGREKLKIADVCSGSGCIGIALARNLTNSDIFLFDVSEIAVEVANINKNRLNTYNVSVFQKDILANDLRTDGNSDGLFDVIVANPPYIPSDEMDDLMPDVQLHEPKIALTDYGDGMTFYKRITVLAKKHLRSGGILAFEVSINRHNDVKRLVNDVFPDNGVEIINDYFGIERIVLMHN